MISRFINRFKRNDLDEQRAFQIKVHNVLLDLYPEKTFTITQDPLTIGTEHSTIGLTNLRSNFLLSSQSDTDLREIVAEHCSRAFAGTQHILEHEQGWESVKTKLMPQLMPAEYLEKMPLVSFPFGDNVVLSFVIDAQDAYSYVRTDELEKWNVSKDELRELAFTNLTEKSRGIEMNVIEGPNGMFIINTLDGFDAVRVLDHGLQKLIAEHIGSPFYFGVPNRDFLICWSKNEDTEFQNTMRLQISNDFDERPWPLSRNVFIVDKDVVELIAPLLSEPRVASADFN